MKAEAVTQRLDATHGTVVAYPDEFFGYFGWPSVARTADGRLIAVASGLRFGHICPFGRTVFCESTDDGVTWTAPRVINDTPLDDRDAGVLALQDGSLLVSWFTSDTRMYDVMKWLSDPETIARHERGLAAITDASAARWSGSWVRRSPDGGDMWEPPMRVDTTTPHGPIQLQDGCLLYLGKIYGQSTQELVRSGHPITAVRSADNGVTWETAGTVPVYEGTNMGNYHEPHVVELSPGRLLGMIRTQDNKRVDGITPLADLGLVNFSLFQTLSKDGGATWSPAEPLGFHGSPPHLIRHSSGAVICVYGRRIEPFGQRVAISRDEGATWQYDYILRDDGPDSDLGYPASVELPDHSVLTVYYQKPTRKEDKCGLLWSRWQLP